MEPTFKVTLDADGIAHLVFDLYGEKVNKFSLPVMNELETVIDNLSKNKEIKLLEISSAKDGVFIAGADLHSFESMGKDSSHVDEMIDTGHRVFDKIAKLPFPTVAVINGACLGGGMELALACSYRIVSDSPKTLLGLPEVTLGIIPGWGGTQRLPRLVGLVNGLPLVLGGKPIKAYQAWKMKLVDAIAATEFFESKTKDFLVQCMTTQGQKQIANRRRRHGISYQLMENNPIGRSLIFNKAKKDIMSKTKGLYPALLIALDLIKETYLLPLQSGLAREKQVFKQNIQTGFSNARNLVHLFFVQEALKKDPGVVLGSDVKPLSIMTAGVIGAGIMGSGITWLFSSRDIPVRMKDIDWKVVGKGLGSIHATYTKMVKDKKLKACEASLKFHRVSGAIDYSGFKQQDLVVEAAVENLELKQKIIAELENVMRPDAIIGSNTSSLMIKDMAVGMKNPERLVGMHFFNPVNRMPLVEIVTSEKTSPQAVRTAVEVSRRLGKTPIVVGDCPGFLVNRLFMLGANEITRLFEEGNSMLALDEMMLRFGMPMSPFALADEVGCDVSYKVSMVLENAYGSRMVTPKLTTEMYKQGLLGKKCGKGFYLYHNNKKKPNPEVERIRKKLGIKPQLISECDMRDRTFLIMINEAARCLDDKIVVNPAYLDMALIMGIGFPPFRGGLLRYADSLGIDYVVDQLKRFKSLYGDRFSPCQRLLDMQKSRSSFF